jgi:hypothetical protein
MRRRENLAFGIGDADPGVSGLDVAQKRQVAADFGGILQVERPGHGIDVAPQLMHPAPKQIGSHLPDGRETADIERLGASLDGVGVDRSGDQSRRDHQHGDTENNGGLEAHAHARNS